MFSVCSVNVNVITTAGELIYEIWRVFDWEYAISGRTELAMHIIKNLVSLEDHSNIYASPLGFY